MRFRILYQDKALIAIDKPAGFHVHPPEDEHHRISAGSNCLRLLRKQLDRYVYPVHRLDRATSGVLLFALDPEMAGAIGRLFQNGAIQKTYYCVTRGWTEPSGVVDRPLGSDSREGVRVAAETAYRRLGTIELPFPSGKFSSSRYSLVEVEPRTGRMHQIRRHLAYLSHPLIGDSIYGHGLHNRIFRENLGISGLLLKAQSLVFTHPETGDPLFIESRWNGHWHQVFDLFGICPLRKPASEQPLA